MHQLRRNAHAMIRWLSVTKDRDKTYYYITTTNLPLTTLQQPFVIGGLGGMGITACLFMHQIRQTVFLILALDDEGGLQWYGLNVWRLMSVFVTWLPLTCKTEMHGEPCSTSPGATNLTEWDTDSTQI